MSNYAVAAEAAYSRTIWYQGKGYIAGVSPGLITVDGTPAARDYTLLDRRTQQIVALGVSAADGTFAIRNLAMNRQYTIFAWDRFNQHNAVIADLITPVLMPEFVP